jgi:hypothetical protein
MRSFERFILIIAVFAFLCPKLAGMQLRSLDRDGSNATWFFINLNARSHVSLDDVRLNSPRSLGEIHRLATALGCPTDAVKLNYAELCALHAQPVVLLRHATEGPGQFAIVLEAHAGSVDLLRTGSIEVEEFDEDDFRRIWTGHALISIRPAIERQEFTLAVLGGVTAAFLPISCRKKMLNFRWILYKLKITSR